MTANCPECAAASLPPKTPSPIDCDSQKSASPDRLEVSTSGCSEIPLPTHYKTLLSLAVPSKTRLVLTQDDPAAEHRLITDRCLWRLLQFCLAVLVFSHLLMSTCTW